MTSNPHILVKNLNVYYDGEQALKNINIGIPAHNITAVIGPSGCGKSTLLKSFNRLLETGDNVRITGSICVDGKNIYDQQTDVTAVRKKMGLLSQRPSPLPMSIYDNVAFGPKLYGAKKGKQLDELVEQRLTQASLWTEVRHRLHDPASKLSIGQQQRLCLARGLAVDPEIILGDEPTSALDPASSQRIEERFLEIKKDYTIILVTHILRQAKRLADYVIFLYMGEVIEAGPARQLFTSPKERKTREYISGIIS